MKKLLKVLRNWGKTFQLAPISYLLLAGLTGYVVWLISTNFMPFGSRDETHIAVIWGLIFAFIFSCYGLLFQINRSKKTTKHRWISLWLQILALPIGYGIYRWFLFLINVWDESWSGFYQVQVMTAWSLLILGIFLLIGFLWRKREKGTWISWNIFLQSVWLGGLASLVLWIGISGSIFSIDKLFFEDLFQGRIYEYLAAVCFIFVNGTFILNYYNYSLEETIPKDETSDFTFLPSKARKIFGNYIFLPLTILYFLILFAYVIKIAITGIWPKEIVVYMGTGYFAFAILCYYFIYPEESSFFNKLKNSILISFFFVGGLMSYAIGVRINQYGLTMRRGIIVLIAICILLYPLLGLLFKNHRLSLLMYTIVWVFGVGIFGPVTIDQLALSSQLSRLNHLLAEENIQIPLGSWALSWLTGESVYQISEKISYIADNYLSAGINQILEEKDICKEDFRRCSPYVKVYLGIDRNDIQYDFDHTPSRASEYLSFVSRDAIWESWLNIKEYSKIYDVSKSLFEVESAGKTTIIDSRELIIPHLDELLAISKKEGYKDYPPYEILTGNMKFLITRVYADKEYLEWIENEWTTGHTWSIDTMWGYLLIK